MSRCLGFGETLGRCDTELIMDNINWCPRCSKLRNDFIREQEQKIIDKIKKQIREDNSCAFMNSCNIRKGNI